MNEEALFNTSKSIEMADYEIDNGERNSEEFLAMVDRFFEENIAQRL